MQMQNTLEAMNVSDFIVQRLGSWGIDRIFGYPGDGINGLLGALDRNEQIRFIQVRHEEMAAFMACGHAKFTGKPGVCLATSGPGAIHLLNGLYDAKMDHQPVVAIVGQQKRSALGSSYQQEVDLVTLFKDVAGAYVQLCTDPTQVQQTIDRALRIAVASSTVTAVILPNDLQEEPAMQEPIREHGHVYTGLGFSPSVLVPEEHELEKAAAILNEGERVAILVGAGALSAKEEVKQVADLLGAGVAKALLGKAVLPDDLPYVTGSIGMLGTTPSWILMEGCDTLLMIGSGLPYAEYLPEVGKARGVQIDINESMLGLRYPMQANLHGDSRATLQKLIPLLHRKEDRSWQLRIEDEVRTWRQVVADRAKQDAHLINPQAVIQQLSPKLPDRCIITADSGTAAFWYARNIVMREGMMGSLSGNLASMCPAIPYALAAKFAFPDRIPIALSGDGAMQMLGMNELITVAKYWKEWDNPQFVVIVLNNRDLNMVTWEQRMLAGDPKFEASQDIPDVDYAAFARLIGLEGIRISNTHEINDALDAMLSADCPALLDVVVDANVPVLPSHIDVTTLENINQAIQKGDPNKAGITRQVIKEMNQGGMG